MCTFSVTTWNDFDIKFQFTGKNSWIDIAKLEYEFRLKNEKWNSER